MNKPQLKHTPAPSFDEAAIRAHCEMLHERANGIDGVLVVSTFYANAGDRPGPITHHAVGDVDDMVAAIMAHATTPGVNIYSGLHVMRRGLERGKRGTERDIVAMLGVVADLDGDTGKTGEMPIEPDFVLETSPGNYQPAIIFDQPATPAEAREIGAALRAATGADHGTVDPAHVWRIPGTLNWPNAAKLARGRSPDPALVTVAAPYIGTLQSVADLKAALAPWAGKASASAPITIGDLPDVGNINVGATVAAMLVASGVGNRSEHAAAVVERLAFDGHSAEQAAALFLASTGDWFGRYSSPADAERDFSRLWAKFGLPHVEAREADSRSVEGLLKPKAAPVAANDNRPKLSAEAAGIRLLSFSEFKAQENSTADALIKGLVRTGTLIAIGGRPGAGKTALTLAMGNALDAGEPFLGRETKPTTVVIIAAEDGGDVANRLEAMDNDRIKIAKLPEGLPLTKPPKAAAVMREVIRQAKSLNPDRHVMVVVDTLRAALGGVSVLEDKTTSPALNALREVAEAEGAVVAILNHTNRENNKATKGETLEAVAALELVLLEGEGDWFTIYVGKNRSGPGHRNIGKVRYTSAEVGGVSAAVVDEIVADESVTDGPKPRGPSGNAQILRGIIQTAFIEATETCRPFGIEGPNVKVVAVDAVRAAFYDRKDGETETKKKAFSRALAYWLDKQWIVRGEGAEGGQLWFASAMDEKG